MLKFLRTHGSIELYSMPKYWTGLGLEVEDLLNPNDFSNGEVEALHRHSRPLLFVHHYCIIQTTPARTTQVKGFFIRWFPYQNTCILSFLIYSASTKCWFQFPRLQNCCMQQKKNWSGERWRVFLFFFWAADEEFFKHLIICFIGFLFKNFRLHLFKFFFFLLKI